MPATTISTTTIDVAAAVAAEITTPVTGTEWLESFTCTRHWLPAHSDSDLASTVYIDVIPITEVAERIARDLTQREHLVELWFQTKVDPEPSGRDTRIDALAAFAFQVKDYFLQKRRVLSTLANVYPMKAKVSASYSPKDLAERNLWVAVVQLTFQERTRQ